MIHVRRLQLAIVSFIVLAVGRPAPCSAEMFELVNTIENPFPGPPGALPGPMFGDSLALAGEYLLIGAPGDDTHAVDGGVAYLVHAVTGQLLQVLNDPTPGFGEQFGASTAIDGRLAAVGSPFDDTVPNNGGAVHVFDAESGNLLSSLLGDSALDQFGAAVALDGNRLVVGAPGADGGAIDDGIVQLLNATTGTLALTLVDPSPANFESFGAALAISGDSIVVGNANADGNATDEGIAYLFDAGSGQMVTTFRHPNPGDFARFGRVVSTDGSSVLITANGGPLTPTSSPVVYLFDAASGTLQRTFLDPDPTEFDSFGVATAVDGRILAIGDRGGLFSAFENVRVFDAQTGDLLQTIVPPQSSPGFGKTIDLDGDLLAVGAPNGAGGTGIVYVYRMVPEPATLRILIVGLVGVAWRLRCFRGT